MDNLLDNSYIISDNVSNDVHGSVVDSYLNRLEVVKMDEQKPINDTDCKHEKFVPDPNDTIGEAIYHGCANPKCGIGFYLAIKK